MQTSLQEGLPCSLILGRDRRPHRPREAGGGEEPQPRGEWLDRLPRSLGRSGDCSSLAGSVYGSSRDLRGKDDRRVG